jgi:hypothetical protein
MLAACRTPAWRRPRATLLRTTWRFPLLQADASTYAKAGQYNADEANQFKLADLQAAEQQYGTDVAARTEIQKANIAAASAKYGVDMSSMTSMQIAGIQAASAKYGVDVSSATDIQKANIAADSAKYGVDVGSTDCTSTVADWPRRLRRRWRRFRLILRGRRRT